jgi:crotonobetainyl-CoA:carnitine CoA-transferase CaiB-like acyl-CoA transferase
LRLAEVSDIVLAAPGGVSFDELRAGNPGLIAVRLADNSDATAGIAAAGAVGLALWDRRRTGLGRQIDIDASLPVNAMPAEGDPETELVSSAVGELRLESPAWRLSETPLHIRLPAPELGEHNTYVFERLLGP